MRHAVLRRYFRHGTLPQLLVFESVARHLNLTRAAEEMHLAQPTVSIQLKKLSEAVGLPLIEQVGRRLYLTDAGTVLAGSCAELLDLFIRAEERFAALRSPHAGPLRVCASHAGTHFLPRVLGSFCRLYPEVQARVEFGNRNALMARLAANLDDLYLVCEPLNDPTIDVRLLFDEVYRVYAPADHRLVGRAALASDEWMCEPLVLREAGSATRNRLLRVFEAHRRTPNARLELGGDEAVKQAVAGGLGLGLLPERIVGRPGHDEAVIALDLNGFPLRAPWAVVSARGRQCGPTAMMFVEHLAERVDAMRAPAR